MRLIGWGILLSLGATALLCAQEAAPPSVDIAPKKTARPAPSPTASVEPTIPPDLPEVSQLDQLFKQSSLGRKADEFRLHAEWRRLRNRIAGAPEVVAAKKAANAARTDLEKRQLLRRYYEICYARMEELAREPEVKAGLEEMKKEHLTTLVQPRVRPSPRSTSPASSESTGATPTPSPSPSPSPAEQSESSQ